MAHESTGIFEKDGDWHIGYCPDVPVANGQGKTLDECRESWRSDEKARMLTASVGAHSHLGFIGGRGLPVTALGRRHA